MNKKALTETDIRTKFITPSFVGSDGSMWDVMTQIREGVYFTNGRVIMRGKTVKRGEAKKTGCILDDAFDLISHVAFDALQRTPIEFVKLFGGKPGLFEGHS
jgi:type I site-specific restriction endonuclease